MFDPKKKKSIFIVNQNQENESNFTSSPFICIAEIDTLWPPSMLSLCGDYVAFSSPKELQVLRLDIRKFSSKVEFFFFFSFLNAFLQFLRNNKIINQINK